MRIIRVFVKYEPTLTFNEKINFEWFHLIQFDIMFLKKENSITKAKNKTQ